MKFKPGDIVVIVESALGVSCHLFLVGDVGIVTGKVSGFGNIQVECFFSGGFVDLWYRPSELESLGTRV